MTTSAEVYNAVQAAGAGLGLQDYQKLRAQIHIYEESILFTRCDDGEKGMRYEVDPRDLAAAFAGQPLSTGLLPHDCLGFVRLYGEDMLMVYIEPGVRELRTADRAYRIPLPGLVFAGSGMVYRVFAVKARPTQSSERLFHAPMPNVYTDRVGLICTGDAEFPRCTAATIWPAVDAFFESLFNAHLVNGKSQKHERDVRDLWKNLHGASKYPLDDLVRAPYIIGDLMGGAR